MDDRAETAGDGAEAGRAPPAGAARAVRPQARAPRAAPPLPPTPGLAPEAGAGIHPTEIVAGVLCVVWVVAVLVYVAGGGTGGSLGIVMTLLVVFLPLALIWVSVTTLRSLRALRAEAGQLQAAVDAMRTAYVAGQQAAAARPSVEHRLDEIAALTRQTGTVVTSIAGRRDAAPSRPARPPAPPDEHPALALGTPAEEFRAPLTMGDFILALHFPESAEDRNGFRAMRLALEDRTASRLVRAAQDVLTLLSQDGIYMDDLKPEATPPELWRRFAAGERGRGVTGLGAIRDRSSLALTAARMREDTVFRDAAHHFLRTFDRTFSAIEPQATDAELTDMADTRTARAFMLFGRVTGTFD